MTSVGHATSTSRPPRWQAPALILLSIGLGAAFLVPVSAADEVMIGLGLTGCLLVLAIALEPVRRRRHQGSQSDEALESEPAPVPEASAVASRPAVAHARLLPDFGIEPPPAPGGGAESAKAPAAGAGRRRRGTAKAPTRADGAPRSPPRSSRSGQFTRVTEPPPPPAPVAVREAAAAEVCAIVCRRTGTRAQFHAVSGDGDEKAAWLAESPAFRLRDGQPLEPTDRARAAHRALVEHLTRRGWQPDGNGDAWYEQRFRRDRARRRGAG
jgi:hypothetical protein